MSFARATATLAVVTAAACTMYFNGRFGWSLGTDLHDKIGLAVFSAAVDLGKCSLLVIASLAWTGGHRGRAALCCGLFAVCLAYSITAGLGFMAGTRDLAHAERQAEAEARERAITAHKRARDALATIDADKMWTTTAACTKTPGKASQTFCARRAVLVADETKAAELLARLPPVDTDPQARLMADNLGISIDRVRLTLSLLPALLAELLSSLGFYALRRSSPDAPGRPQGGSHVPDKPRVVEDVKTAPAVRPKAPAPPPKPAPEKQYEPIWPT